MGLNMVALAGNITRDPELKQAGSTTVLEFGLAVNDRVNKDGEWVDYANFFDCAMFGRRAESVSKFIEKGMKVAIKGKLRYSSWDDRETGKKRSKVSVNVDDIEFMQGNGRPQSSESPYSDDPIPF